MEIHEDDNAEEFLNADPKEVKCPENIIRKKEKLMDLVYVINEIQNNYIFEIIKCAHEVILSQCVLDAIRVNMSLTLSMLRIDFYRYRLIGRNIPSSEIFSLREKFCELPGSLLDKLKALHSEVFSKINWGRLVVFLNIVETLGLTDEEWEQLYDFLVPTLSQIRE